MTPLHRLVLALRRPLYVYTMARTQLPIRLLDHKLTDQERAALTPRQRAALTRLERASGEIHHAAVNYVRGEYTQFDVRPAGSREEVTGE